MRPVYSFRTPPTERDTRGTEEVDHATRCDSQERFQGRRGPHRHVARRRRGVGPLVRTLRPGRPGAPGLRPGPHARGVRDRVGGRVQRLHAPDPLDLRREGRPHRREPGAFRRPGRGRALVADRAQGPLAPRLRHVGHDPSAGEGVPGPAAPAGVGERARGQRAGHRAVREARLPARGVPGGRREGGRLALRHERDGDERQPLRHVADRRARGRGVPGRHRGGAGRQRLAGRGGPHSPRPGGRGWSTKRR